MWYDNTQSLFFSRKLNKNTISLLFGAIVCGALSQFTLTNPCCVLQKMLPMRIYAYPSATHVSVSHKAVSIIFISAVFLLYQPRLYFLLCFRLTWVLLDNARHHRWNFDNDNVGFFFAIPIPNHRVFNSIKILVTGNRNGFIINGSLYETSTKLE